MAFGLQRSIVEGIFIEYTMRTLGIYGKFVVRMNEKNNNVKQGLHTASYPTQRGDRKNYVYQNKNEYT